MDSPMSTERSQKKKLSSNEPANLEAQQLKNDSEKFLQRPTSQIANPDRDLNQSYDKGFFKDKRFDHFRYLKKVRNKTEKDSVSSQLDDDQEYSIEKPQRKNKKKQNTDEDKLIKKRGRKPKNQVDNTTPVPQKQATLTQHPNNETQIVKKRGRPKGSFNKNKKQSDNKQQQKKQKQFQCLKKIEPKQKDASSLQDDSQQSEQQIEKKTQKMVDEKEKEQPNKPIQNNKKVGNQQESEEKEGQSESQQQSEQQQSEEKRPNAEHNDNKQNKLQQSQEASQESQDSSENQKQNNSIPLKLDRQNTQKQKSPKINRTQTKIQESLAPVRGKKLFINSSTPSENSQITGKKNQIRQSMVKIENNFQKVDQQRVVSNSDLLPQQLQLNKLTKRRGRKSHETQLKIQRLKEAIQKKKNNTTFFQNKNQKIQQQMPRAQQYKNENQRDQKQAFQINRKPRIISSMYQHKRNHEEKPAQVKIVSTSASQRVANKIPTQNKFSFVDRKQIQRQIYEQKVKKLAMQSKIYSQQIRQQEHIDPQQLKLFKGWTKYYKKFNQTLVMQEQQEEVQHVPSHRKKASKQKFKRYRKVIIQESCDDVSDEGHRIKKVRKQKRIEPRVIFHAKKSKSKRKHRDSSSSGSAYD